ncbi:hypothetical protein Hamer_G025550 [Homarus americanus]|uniref:Uncharacterized protein n=2 Tax=Homarus americanus TaxID=6706 RepID=A0A8J5TVE8_HOMAM|nr:hypothetical protein Hamer_G025550 [Homarus americanus]
MAAIMKDKGLSASDILHNLGSLFTVADQDTPNPDDNNTTSRDNNTTSGETRERGEDEEETSDTKDEDSEEGSSSTSQPETDSTSTVSLRPYNPSAGSERYHPRPYRPLGQGGGWGGGGNQHRSIITNRRHTTLRPTLRPPYQPPPIKPTELDVLHTSTPSSNDNKLPFGLPGGGIPVGTLSGQAYHPRYNNDYIPVYDNDPNSLNMSTKSAIMAASVLGGVAMCVFLAILVVVMYRGRVRFRRTPLALSSNASSSSLPPIYSTRFSGGKSTSKSSGLWGTLKKRFDPYSLSPTPTVMT